MQKGKYTKCAMTLATGQAYPFQPNAHKTHNRHSQLTFLIIFDVRIAS